VRANADGKAASASDEAEGESAAVAALMARSQ
jgi:hypothetical protein